MLWEWGIVTLLHSFWRHCTGCSCKWMWSTNYPWSLTVCFTTRFLRYISLIFCQNVYPNQYLNSFSDHIFSTSPRFGEQTFCYGTPKLWNSSYDLCLPHISLKMYLFCVCACMHLSCKLYIYDVDCVLSMYYHLKWNKFVSRTRKRNGKLAGLFYVRIGCVVITNTTSRFCSTLFTSQVVQWPRPAMTCLTQVTRWTLDL